MNIETKEVSLSANGRSLATYEAFGWKYTQDVHHSRYRYELLARDKDMPNYRLIKALESKYESLLAQKKTYSPVNEEPEKILIMVLLFLLFVFPLVIYLVFKSRQKAEYAEHNALLEKEMQKIMKEARALL
ncbi:MAG: hypothetical protein SOV58_00350 [Candidatus Enteromonas sp.]|nr:hypothetical protein [Candidatus Enteromonas sp.]